MKWECGEKRNLVMLGTDKISKWAEQVTKNTIETY